MKPHIVNDLNNFIAGWTHDDTAICDEIIDYFKNSPRKTAGSIGRNVVDTTVKDCVDCDITDLNLRNRYLNFLQNTVNQYIEKYPLCNYYAPWSTIENFNIQWYLPNTAYYAWHTERCNKMEPIHSRHLVFMTYLNTVTDNGETEFFHQNLKIKPEKGLTLIWPADWTFTHRGVASPTQEKYIVTGWFNFLQ